MLRADSAHERHPRPADRMLAPLPYPPRRGTPKNGGVVCCSAPVTRNGMKRAGQELVCLWRGCGALFIIRGVTPTASGWANDDPPHQTDDVGAPMGGGGLTAKGHGERRDRSDRGSLPKQVVSKVPIPDSCTAAKFILRTKRTTRLAWNFPSDLRSSASEARA